ncbi:hypothetical protein FRB99_001176 [Tulasnella sp. 403]|nr:hypothetical protein FRB99_001176 [Tulasnella sp. 403]
MVSRVGETTHLPDVKLLIIFSRRYPYVFGTWKQDIAAEQPFYQSIAKSYCRMFLRSQNRSFTKPGRTMYKSLKNKLEAHVERGWDQLLTLRSKRNDPLFSSEELAEIREGLTEEHDEQPDANSEEDFEKVFCGAMTLLYSTKIRPGKKDYQLDVPAYGMEPNEVLADLSNTDLSDPLPSPLLEPSGDAILSSEPAFDLVEDANQPTYDQSSTSFVQDTRQGSNDLSSPHQVDWDDQNSSQFISSGQTQQAGSQIPFAFTRNHVEDRPGVPAHGCIDLSSSSFIGFDPELLLSPYASPIEQPSQLESASEHPNILHFSPLLTPEEWTEWDTRDDQILLLDL